MRIFRHHFIRILSRILSRHRLFIRTTMSSLLLLFAIALTIQASNIYIRPLPIGISIDGMAGNTITTDSVIDCVVEWAENPPKAVVYDEMTRNCTAYRIVYGTTDALSDERGFLVDESDEDVCPRKAMDDLHLIADCRGGWPKLTFLNSSGCYHDHIFFDSIVEMHTSKGENPLKECTSDYPFANVASVHSEEENEAIAKRFRSSNVIGLMLVDANEPDNLQAWKWFDDSEVDFLNFVEPRTLVRSAKVPRISIYSGSGGWGGNSSQSIMCKYMIK